MALPALVLAGRRHGRDALAESRGTSHRALVEVGGVPMLVRVVRALRAAAGVGPVAVRIDAAQVLDAVPELREARAAGHLQVRPSASSPSRSVALELEERGAPLLVTTADHPLLSPAMLEHLLRAADASDADVVVGVVARSTARRCQPAMRRTWIPLRDDAWTGANLFVCRTARARDAALFWADAERFRKRPWRLALSLGVGFCCDLLLRRHVLEAAFARASRAVGARLAPVALPWPAAALDVDGPDDLRLAEALWRDA
jgi:GTP:adenosylcobinamide-phosphate guanylyltransferase